MQNSRDMAERIESVVKEKGISVSKLLVECSLNKNALYTMKTGGYFPRIEAILKIADYLSCSVDYLLGRISTSEQELLQNYRKISPAAKKQIHKIINNEVSAASAAPAASGDLLAELLEIEKNTAQIAAYGGGTTTVSGGDIDLDEIE